MGAFSRQNIKAAARQYVPLALGLRIPGFIRIHGRYARRSMVTWFVLVIAPFIFGASSLSIMSRKLLERQLSGLQIFFIALFVIAVAFFFAERNRLFRRVYVAAIPAMVIINGLVNFVIARDLSLGSVIVFVLLTLLPAWWLGRHAMGKGYRLLSNGADKDYRPGRDLYMDGAYTEGFAHLEPSAKRGHMKSLYLIGHAHEHGNGRECDRVLAARFYDKSSRKGYRKASAAFEALYATFSPEEIKAFEAELGTTGINELF
ncbi:MAG: hypothetical protein ACSHXY_10525 [Alphaproteobacteria bacterium]